MIPLIHTHVTHAKMPELGVGEILSSDGDRISIRFATGERNFICALVQQHLSVTTEAVPPNPNKVKATRAKKAAVPKATAAKAAAAAAAAAAAK